MATRRGRSFSGQLIGGGDFQSCPQDLTIACMADCLTITEYVGSVNLCPKQVQFWGCLETLNWRGREREREEILFQISKSCRVQKPLFLYANNQRSLFKKRTSDSHLLYSVLTGLPLFLI